MTPPPWAPPGTEHWTWEHDPSQNVWDVVATSAASILDLTGPHVPPSLHLRLNFGDLTSSGQAPPSQALRLIVDKACSLVIRNSPPHIRVETSQPDSEEPSEASPLTSVKGVPRAHLTLVEHPPRSIHATIGPGLALSISASEAGNPPIHQVEVNGSGELTLSKLAVHSLIVRGRPFRLSILDDAHIERAQGSFDLVAKGLTFLKGDPHSPPQVSKLEVLKRNQVVPPPTAGGPILLNVDITPMPISEMFTELTHVLHVEPAGKPLRKWARVAAKGLEAHLATEWIYRLNALLLHQPISGTTDTSARWAAARLHHATAPRWERLLRLPLRVVGYNARPGPPLAAWLITSGLIAAIHLLLTHPAPAILPTVLSTPLLPLAAVGRVGTDSGILPALTGPGRLLATIAVAAPLASALIALRRLLRTPISAHPQ